jgi:hypothetical protein
MNHQAEPTCPVEILDWIAWYPDGGLSDAQRGAVEAHAASCEACRSEIEILAGHTEPPDMEGDPERLFGRVLARIESATLAAEPLDGEARGAVAANLGHRRAPAPLRNRRASAALRSSQTWMAGTAWAAGIGIAVLLGGVWIAHTIQVARATPIYQVAGEPTAAAALEHGVALDLVFRNDASAERINVELRGLGARIVSGPSQLGRYRIELPEGADAQAAATLLRAEGTGVASFAEPVRP